MSQFQLNVVVQFYLSDFGIGMKSDSTKALKRFATALRIAVDDLVLVAWRGKILKIKYGICADDRALAIRTATFLSTRHFDESFLTYSPMLVQVSITAQKLSESFAACFTR